MSLDELWRIARRYWVILLVAGLGGLALAWVRVSTQPKQYTATTSAYVTAGLGTSNAGDGDPAARAYSNSMLAKEKAQAWLPVFTSTPVLDDVAKKLNKKASASTLAGSVSAAVDAEAPLITVEATSPTPQAARDMANAVVQSSASRVEALEGSSSGAAIRPLQNAQLPSSPSAPKPSRTLPLGLLAGLALGFLIAFILTRRDTRLRSATSVEQVAGTSVLASIPESQGLAMDPPEPSPEDFRTREALRQLRTNLRFVDPDSPPRAVVVTSSRMGEGKSSIASNLARVLAESGEKVLLIDADLRRPMVSAILDVEPEVGLSQVIAGSVEAQDAILQTSHCNMFALPAGQIPPNPSELLGSRSMKRLIGRLRQEYFIVLDAPPLLPVTDAALLLPSTDGALIVVDGRGTRSEHLAHAIRNIEAVNGHVLGAVMNHVKFDRAHESVYGEYGYGYPGESADGKGKRFKMRRSGAQRASRERASSATITPSAPATAEETKAAATRVARKPPTRRTRRDERGGGA